VSHNVFEHLHTWTCYSLEVMTPLHLWTQVFEERWTCTWTMFYTWIAKCTQYIKYDTLNYFLLMPHVYVWVIMLAMSFFENLNMVKTLCIYISFEKLLHFWGHFLENFHLKNHCMEWVLRSHNSLRFLLDELKNL
jgi:hypothetical protein